ncbi:MAG: glucose-1-phosphate adenylyltransferase [Candidatus Hydrogenedentes bacterium]|nr:glucose-1-phosphate adenylyltransferase [Candidatus Hydrogenedentota bacterium]
MERVGAIVLGGGRGTRLYPLTAVRAKPAVPLAGRYRLVDIPLSNCIHSGITRIVVLTQFNSHSLKRHINNTYQFDVFTGGYVEVLSAEQTMEVGDWFQGTADAVRKQLLHIRDLNAQYYIILSGDQLYHMDYRTMMATHLKKEADITVSALPVSRVAAQSFGVMKLKKDGRIAEFVEKPKEDKLLDQLVTPEELFKEFSLEAEGKPYLGSMGVYIFNAKVLEDLVEQHPEWDDFGRELLPNALKTHRVFAHMFYGFWEDIGSVRSYFDVSMELTSEKPPFDMHDPEYPIFTHRRALPGVKMIDAHIKNSIVCGGSQIGKASVSNSIIGIRSIIQSGAAVDRSIILGAEYYEGERMKDHPVPMGIGKNCKISNAIIDHNARIGKNVTIHGSRKLKDCENEAYVVRDGIVVVLKNAVIPDGAVIG